MKKRKKTNTMFSNFIYLVKIYLRYAKGWFVIVALSSFIPPIQVYIDTVILRDSINAVTSGGGFASITTKLIIFAGIYILTLIINNIIEVYMGENMNVKIANRINKDIYLKVLKTDFKYFDDPEFYNNYTWTLNSFYQQTFSAVQLIWQALTTLLTLGTLITLVASMDFVIILFALVSVLITTWINLSSNKEIYKKSEESLPHQRKLGYIQRIFYLKDFSMGLKSTKIKDVFMNQYDESTKKLSRVIKKHRVKITLLSLCNYSVFFLLKMATLIYLVFSAVNGRINVGEMAALFYAADSLKGNLNGFFTLLAKTQNLNLYTEKIRAFFDLKSQIELEIPSKGLSINDQAYSICFNNVSFKYNDNGKDILKNLNFDIKPKQKIAIVGENGAGKSTITKLLLHLYDVSEGEIYINEHKISDLNVNDLRNNIGIAFQDSFMYAMSIEDNICVYMDEKVKPKKLQNVISKLNITKIIEKNNADINTPLTKEFDNNGIELSGGERQLIAISRVLVKDFGLLILDEPSSSLDPLIEYELNKIIMEETKNSTVIIISHRLSAVRDADCIFMLSNGEIKEKGTHYDLMSQKGKYYEMFTKQAENYIKD